MGTCRLILALLVAIAHLRVAVVINEMMSSHAVFAVRAFFIISGFYMAMVITERYQARGWRDFMASRLLKLLPVYWVVSALTLIAEASLAGADGAFFPGFAPLAAWRNLDLTALPNVVMGYVGLTIATLFGADTWTWIGFNPATGAFSTAPDYGAGTTSALALAPVPQAWTLGIELYFYVIAPFVVLLRLRWILMAVLVLSAMRVLMWKAGIPAASDAFDRTLFPLELTFFLVGIVAFRGLGLLRERKFSMAMCVASAAAGCVTIVCLRLGAAACQIGVLSCHWKATAAIGSVSYFAVAAVVPFLFELTKSNRIDSILGNLSYPAYLSQFLVFAVLNVVTGGVSTSTGWWPILVVSNLFAVVVFALVIDRTIARPIDSAVCYSAHGDVRGSNHPKNIRQRHCRRHDGMRGAAPLWRNRSYGGICCI